jgi:hypothetical protein
MRIGVLQGNSTFEINSGGIAVDEALGRMTADISSGSLSIEDFSGHGEFELSAGNLNLDMRELAGDLRFRLSSGTASVDIPRETSFNLDALPKAAG